MKLTKKSQIKMTETIGVLVIFFILVLFGFIFYTQYQKSAIKQQQEELTAKNAVATSLTISFLPELRCSEKDIPTIGCIDKIKFDMFKTKLEDPDSYSFYSKIFGKSTIYLENIILETEIVLYNNTPEISTRTIPIRFPLVIYNPLTSKKDFGVLYVDIYS